LSFLSCLILLVLDRINQPASILSKSWIYFGFFCTGKRKKYLSFAVWQYFS
jgi:hypothetical protein